MYPASSGIYTLVNFMLAILFAQSIIVFVDVLVNFKRSGALKNILLLFAFNTAFVSFGFIYCNYYGYNRWLVDVPSNTMGITIVLFLSSLYQHQIKKYMVFYIVLIAFSQLLVNLYFSFIIPVDPSINLLNVEEGRDLIRSLRFGYLAGLIYIVVNLFFKIRRRYSLENIYHDEYIRWVTFLVILMIIMLLTSIFRNFYNFSFFVSGIIIAFELFIIMLAFLYRPKFLNSANLQVSLSDVFNRSQNLNVSSELFFDIFSNKLYYLNSEASLDDLANLLKINPDELYRFIYDNYNSSFNDLINQHRVYYFIDLVKSGKYAHYTIDALAQKCGFSSRHHLFKPFRKFHGGNPSEFIRSVTQ